MRTILGRWKRRALWCSVIALSPFWYAYASRSEEQGIEEIELAENEGNRNVVTIDHAVPHVSTVPANAGLTVDLFVRERDAGLKKNRSVVLMIHSRSVPVLAASELEPDSDYDWAFFLAKSGFDVFMLDFQGSGLSPRPKMDNPCNVPAAQQASILIPNPLTAKCLPSYPFILNDSGSDLDELDTVIDYIRNLRGVDKVHILSWSQGSFRIGPYAVSHPEKVASLFFLAPIFNTQFQPTGKPSGLPISGTPMTLTTRAAFESGWDVEVKCETQREAAIKDAVWAAIMENDELGRTWGPPPAGAPAGSPPEGVMRVRQVTLWGWNSEVAAKLTVPTLIIQGEFDTGQGARQHLAKVVTLEDGTQVPGLYSLVNNPNKLRFRVQCTGHFMQWENQRRLLHHVSKEWLKHGKVAGFSQGEFFIDTAGNLSPL
jgi:pimeloyl-ACP methyl ester carboxylesterase